MLGVATKSRSPPTCHFCLACKQREGSGSSGNELSLIDAVLQVAKAAPRAVHRPRPRVTVWAVPARQRSVGARLLGKPAPARSHGCQFVMCRRGAATSQSGLLPEATASFAGLLLIQIDHENANVRNWALAALSCTKLSHSHEARSAGRPPVPHCSCPCLQESLDRLLTFGSTFEPSAGLGQLPTLVKGLRSNRDRLSSVYILSEVSSTPQGASYTPQALSNSHQPAMTPYEAEIRRLQASIVC